MVPADSQQIPRARCYSGITSTTHAALSRTGLSPTTATLSRSLPLTPHTRRQTNGSQSTVKSHTTHTATPAGYHTRTVWPHPLSLATTHGILIYFLFLWVLRCFTSPRSLYPPYIFRRESSGRASTPDGVSPFGHPRITARLTAPRGLSRPPTSFIGS